MLDSMLCALGPLVYMTSFIPGLKGVDSEQMVIFVCHSKKLEKMLVSFEKKLKDFVAIDKKLENFLLQFCYF